MFEKYINSLIWVHTLVKLHRHPNALRAKDRPTKRDKRVELRLDVWTLAQHQLEQYEEFRDEPVFNEVLAGIIANDLAPGYGFFSIWMTVFRNHPDMLHRFINAFPGTDAACFDGVGNPVLRPGGRL